MKIFSTGDLHIGQSLKYGKTDSSGRSDKLQEQQQMLSDFVDKAIEEKADVVAFNGDYFPKHFRINPDAMRIFAEQVLRLDKAGITVLVLDGNHDKSRVEASDSTVALFDVFKLKNVRVINKPELIWINDVGFAMMPHLIPAELETYKHKDSDGVVEAMHNAIQSLSDEVVAQRENGKGTEPCIFFGHFGIAEAGRGSETTMIAGNNIAVPAVLLDLPAFNWCILGHIHKRWDWEGQFSKISYLGAMDRFDFAEAGDIKQYGIINVEDNEVTLEFVNTNAREFIDIKHDFSVEQNYEFLNEYDFKDTVVKVSVEVDKDFVTGKELVSELRQRLEDAGVYHIHAVNLVYKPTYVSQNEAVTEAESIEDNLKQVLADEKFDDIDELMQLHEVLTKELRAEEDAEAEKS